MEYEVQYARITTAGKLPDRFLNCQSRQSSDLSKAYMGTIYSLVEIISPWFTTSQVGQSIINTFSQSYYSGESTSDLDNFEEALKKVNENLTLITQNGETNWIGNLNAILAVQIENKILLAQTGHAEAYIFREGKINHLTYGLNQSQAETHPSKTFSNITSGELKSHDRVLFANPDLFNSMEMDSLREIISMNQPNDAILQIAKILKRKKARSINVLILELMTLEEASNLPVVSANDNIHLDRPIESVWIVLDKFWTKILRPILFLLGKYLKMALIKLVAMVKGQVRKAQERKQSAPPEVINDRFQQEFIKDANADEGLLKDEEIEYSPELNVHYYEQAQKRSQTNHFNKVSNIALGALSKTLVWFASIWENKKTRPYFLAALGVIILLILGLVVCSHRPEKPKKGLTLLQAQTILKDAQASQKAAKTASLAGDNEAAKTKYDDCANKAQQVLTVDMVKSDATDALDTCQSELDTLTNTTRFGELTPIVSSSASIKATFITGNQAVLVGPNDIYTTSTAGGKPNRTATIPRNNGDFQFGAADQNLYFYTSNQKVYGYNLTNNTLGLANVSGSWETANSASFFNGNFYLLDGIMGKIYRHSLNQGSQANFGGGQSYTTNTNNLKNGVSMAIDGAIYVLHSSGTVSKFQNGKAVDFSLQGLPTPHNKIEQPIKIYTDSDTTSIYILDNATKRIVEFDKDGHFIHQYALPSSFSKITDFSVSAKTKKIWILNQNNLYQIGI